MRNRIVLLIEATTTPHKRFKELEEWTGVPADSWRKFVTGKQRATSEMIEALGKQFPKYCEWLLTGERKAKWQEDPTEPRQSAPGSIDLSVLDETFESEMGGKGRGADLGAVDYSDHLTKEEIERMVEAMFAAKSKRKRKNDNQGG